MGFGTELDGCGRFMKYSLFFSNFVIFIGGVVVTGLTIWALQDEVTWIGELVGDDTLTGAVYVLLVGGIVVTIISFLGCFGASQEVKCMLLTYFIIVSLLFVTMLVGGVLGYVYREKFLTTIEQQMSSTLRFYDRQKSIRDAWDTTQSTLHCCGVNGWRDWGFRGLKMPESCCREIRPGKRFDCNTDPVSGNAWSTYVDGCLEGTQNFMQQHAAVMGGAGIAVACLMFFGMIFSCALFKMIE